LQISQVSLQDVYARADARAIKHWSTSEAGAARGARRRLASDGSKLLLYARLAMTDSGDLDAAVVSASRPSHRFTEVANPSRRTARWILAGLALLLAAGLWRPLPRHGTDIPVERTDNALFSAVI